MTLLIKGGQLIGTSEGGITRADVFVHGGKITAIGAFPAKKADVVIDAHGMYVSPGFIDVHGEADHSLGVFEDPEQTSALRQGITTTIGGHAGVSLAPLLYGSLEAMEEWSRGRTINVNWHTVAELFSELKRRPLGVNFGTFVGHTTIRRALTGDKERNLTKSELSVVKTLLARSLREGAFGLSVDSRALLSRDTPRTELKTLARIVKSHNGILSTTLGYTRGEELTHTVDAILGIIQETGVSALASHMLPLANHAKQFKDALARMSDAGGPKKRVCLDLPGTRETIVPIRAFLPRWAEKGTTAHTAAELQDPWFASKIEKELPEFDSKHVAIAYAARHPALAGRTLSELKTAYGVKDARAALIKVMRETRLSAFLLISGLDQKLIDETLENPHALLATHGAGEESVFGNPPIPALLAHAIHSGHEFLESAVQKLTAAPARFLRLSERGELKEGYRADLTGFSRDGVHFTIVNGFLALRDGAPLGVRAGVVLRPNGS